MTSDARTIVIGADALDFRYLDEFQDTMPNVDRLRRTGVEAPLRSTFPPWTASAWPSMYTGTDPSFHGVYDFFRFDGYPDEGSLVSRNDVQAPAIWNYLTGEGIPSVVVNVPVTHPAEPIEGVLIPGYLAPEDAAGYPDGVQDELSAALETPYRIYSRGEVSDDADEKFDGYLDLIELRKRAAVNLLTNRPWRLAILQIQKTDAVFHNFDDKRSFRKIYEAFDDFVGAVIDAIDEEVNVIICSDHGIGPVRSHRIFVNEVLRRHGYLETTEADGHESLHIDKRRLMEPDPDEPDETSLDESILSLAAGALTWTGLPPARLYDLAKALRIEEKVLDLVPASLVRESLAEHVDWRASSAYCGRETRLGIRINLEGREPAGVVQPHDYEQVRTDIIDLLRDLRTPDGDLAFERVLRRDELYDGPQIDNAPDIILHPNRMDNSLSTAVYGRQFLPENAYDHKLDGVFVGHGPAFDGGATLEQMSLTDVAPVVMALSGCPVPRRITGEVPPGLLSIPTSRRSYDVPYATSSRTTEDESSVTERLEDLGYR